MATYQITDPQTGRTVKLTGDSPPTEEELNQVFASIPSAPIQPAPKASMMQKLGAVVKPYNDSQLGSPIQLAQTLQPLLSKGAGKVGGAVTEFLGEKQVNPLLSAGVGTAISMAPDIALTALNTFKSAQKVVPAMAIGPQRRALGMIASDLKTEFARGQAAKAAQVSLEQGITSATGNPATIFKKANDLKIKSGQQLGAIRDSVGPQPIQPVLNAIDDYKAVRLKGATGGKWDQVLRKIDDAKDTVKGLLAPGAGDKVPLKRVADAKKEIADSVNWMADNVSQQEAKGLAMAIEKGSEQALIDAGGDIKKYKAIKPIYSAAKTMIKGLNKELARQEGNMAVSLPALVAGAAGGPAGALKMGAFELAKRRGAGIAASEIMSAANAPAKLGLPLVQAARTLTEDKAKEFLRKARGNRDRARKMAEKEGYEIPIVE